MIFLIINYLINILFASFEGVREGAFFFEDMNSSKIYPGKSAHKLFVYLRSCFWTLSTLFAFVVIKYVFNADIENSIIYSGLILLSEFLIFPFFHDGFYYLERNRLDKTTYPKRFLDSSTTSTALMELSFMERLMVFVGGTILYIVICLFV